MAGKRERGENAIPLFQKSKTKFRNRERGTWDFRFGIG
jgi:hypothetical protein